MNQSRLLRTTGVGFIIISSLTIFSDILPFKFGVEIGIILFFTGLHSILLSQIDKYLQERKQESDINQTNEIVKDEITILIPTLNEEKTISSVISQFKNEGFRNIFVIDGDSEDETVKLATENGAEVAIQSGSGKGQAVKEAIEKIETEYILMVDGDSTYNAKDAESMIAPLEKGYSHVIGNRFAEMDEDAMPKLNKLGNKSANLVFSFIYRKNLKDILSGYRAFETEAINEIGLEKDGFEIETELASKSVEQNIPTKIVPIRYHSRPNGSDTNLEPLNHGIPIARYLIKQGLSYNRFVVNSIIGLVLLVLSMIIFINNIIQGNFDILTPLVFISVSFFLNSTGLVGARIISHFKHSR